MGWSHASVCRPMLCPPPPPSTKQSDILDWHGDHLATNYHDLYNALRDKGYYVETLSGSATCFDAANYGALLVVDSEEEFYPAEVEKLARDVKELGLGLVVFAEW